MNKLKLSALSGWSLVLALWISLVFDFVGFIAAFKGIGLFVLAIGLSVYIGALIMVKVETGKTVNVFKELKEWLK